MIHINAYIQLYNTWIDRQFNADFFLFFIFFIDCTHQANKPDKSNGFVSVIVLIFWSPTSSMVSSCGVAALSSESFCEPVSAFLRTSRLFLCLCASFFTWPSALPLLSRLTGLVSHLRRVFPGRLGPGELCKWPGCSVALPESPPSLLETESVSSKKERERETWCLYVFLGPVSVFVLQNCWKNFYHNSTQLTWVHSCAVIK